MQYANSLLIKYTTHVNKESHSIILTLLKRGICSIVYSSYVKYCICIYCSSDTIQILQ